MGSKNDPVTGFARHNHKNCCGRLMGQADQLAEGGLRLTPVRRRALEILMEEHRAMGAYDVLEKLAESGFGKQPPVAYRALDFLVENGLAHRIGRLNAYTACMRPGEAHVPTFYICESCDTVAEDTDIAVSQAVGAAASRIGFQVERANFEVVGICPTCVAGAAQ